MPAPARKRTTATLARPASESRPILAVLLGVLGTFLLIAMAFHTLQDAVWGREWLEQKFLLPATTGAQLVSNPCGSFGASVAVLFFSLFGYAAFLIPGFLFLAAWFALNNRAHTLWPTKVALMAACIVFGAPILTRWLGLDSEIARTVPWGAFDPKGAGGILGDFLYHGLSKPVLGEYGVWVLVIPYLFCLLGVVADDPKATLAAWIAELRDSFGAWNAERKAAALKAEEERRRRAVAAAELRRRQQEIVGAEVAPAAQPKSSSKAAAIAAVLDVPLSDDLDELDLPPVKKGRAAKATEPEPVEPKEPAGPETVQPETVTITPSVAAVAPSPAKPEPAKPEPAKPEPVKKTAEPEVVSTVGGGKVLVVKPEAIERAKVSQQPKKSGDYIYPDLKHLAKPKEGSEAPSEDFRKRAQDLIETLKQFKVECIPVDPAAGIDVGIQQGPSITRYEIKPAPGVRVEKIANLSNNIAMNLEAEAVRILAPVPGKGTVGIEIPNRVRKDVLLREIIESQAWVDARAKMDIPVVLGVDSVTGKPVIADLAKMPHCLIAGSTGQGKSVCINAFIASLLYRHGPADLRFIMVDPKVVELQVYSKLPHLLVPVETDPKRVPAALKWLVAEMSKRYKIFGKCGVKNIAGFNAKIVKEAGQPKQEELPLSPEEQAAATEAAENAFDDGVTIPTEKLPYIVCIIDEMADLMMVAAKDIETLVARLAQLARAAGIHLVLATQRPSTDVITGLIKANFPTRIAFKVSSQIDSRTILDRGGAESLVGRGDMLFIPPGTAMLNRVQGAFIGEQEITAIVDEINAKNGGPEFAQDIVEAINNASEEGDEDLGEVDVNNEDALIERCWQIIKTHRRASVSMLQRKLKLGYNRAARIMDALEERGYVGPENGSSPREILRED
jgi:S-DNA-T family DNA segregation ATPase FtsK/SpoIIIE